MTLPLPPPLEQKPFRAMTARAVGHTHADFVRALNGIITDAVAEGEVDPSWDLNIELRCWTRPARPPSSPE